MIYLSNLNVIREDSYAGPKWFCLYIMGITSDPELTHGWVSEL